MTAGLKTRQTSLLGEHSEREPPDPIPNSEVKPLCADDSVAGCHVKVGHRQALILKSPVSLRWGFFLFVFLGSCQDALNLFKSLIH